MTDERSRQHGDRLDEAIDRTVQALMRRDAPSTLRALVIARLKEDSTSVATWSPRRLAWTGAAAAVVIAAVLAVPRWWPRPDVPPFRTAADATPARSGPTSAPVVSPAAPRSSVAQDAPSDRAAARAPRETREGGEAASVSGADRPPFVDPLPALDAIVIAALETDRVTPDVVEIESLKLDSLHIEPLSAQR